MQGHFGPPFSLVSLLVGAQIPIATTLSAFLGALTGRKLIAKKLGADRERYRYILVAGIGMGEGIMAGIGATIALITRSIWMLPY